jgi:peptidoglycan hydrolase CwlO-like protein
MNQYITEIITLFFGGFSMWLWQKLKTKRERRRDDLQLVNEITTTFLSSIQSLTEQYTKTQEKNLIYLQENINMKSEIQSLKKQIDHLTQEIENLKNTPK